MSTDILKSNSFKGSFKQVRFYSILPAVYSTIKASYFLMITLTCLAVTKYRHIKNQKQFYERKK